VDPGTRFLLHDPADDACRPNVRYPRVEFREFDPDAEPFHPSWETALPAVNATLNGWLRRIDEGPFAEVVVDDDGRRWQLSAHAEDGALRWRVEMAGYQWFLSATSWAGRPPTA
jgi:hypothetical protein